jgi:molecular chaperone GrpE
MIRDDDTIKNGEREEEQPENTEEQVTEGTEKEPRKPAVAKEDEIDWEGKYKRALADYQNLEKRVAEQRRALMLSAGRQVLERLLPVLDTLQLASKHVHDQGLTVSIQQFEEVLKAEGVVRIEAKGKKFDPALMEAVGTDAGDEGTVLEEARAGYLLHEKLLRPAQVIVGAGKGK